MILQVILWLLSHPSQAALSRAEIRSLIQQGESGASQCNRSFDKIRALDKHFDYGRTFPNKKITLKVIELLKVFPGTPPATRALMDKLVIAKSSTLDAEWLSKEMNKTIVCDPMTLNLVFTKLARSGRTFSFTKSEKKKMAQVILSQLRKEAQYPTHLGLLAPYILIMDSLIEQHAISVSEDAAVLREGLNSELNKGLARLKDNEEELKRKINDPAFQTENFISEVRDNEKFRIKFLTLLDHL